ncbi:unnamed protein product [Sphagnum troendelagicum]|uniref:Uncharacterized protein n=1 Tax=Sphagnum troendelagicum TaxID=128251 RepID=A0ABP0U4X0_9BRYO
MSNHGSHGRASSAQGQAVNRQASTPKRLPFTEKKQSPWNGVGGVRKPGSGQSVSSGERTVRRLRLSKALTIPDGTTVADACRRMVSRRVDAALLTDSSALLCGIITDKDVAMRVIAEGLKPEETSVAKVMTRNPIFVTGDTLAVEALQKMVQGKFRHLPVVEKGEVVALLDITKCLYDAIARMERAAEKGSAIAAAVEGVERQWGQNLTEKSSFLEMLRERMFRPTLGSLITEGTRVATVSQSDTVYTATKRMKEHRMNSVIITGNNNKPQGIFTSKDLLMKVIAQGLLPESTTMDKVMTPNPECAGLDTTLVDALHIMHDGKFLHLPVVDQEGYIVGCIDVLQLTNGAVATVGSSGGGADMASTMMQKFWDSALTLEPPEDDDDSHSDISARLTSEAYGSEVGRQYPSLGLGNSYCFKLKLVGRDGKESNHRFNCGTESLFELVCAIAQRIGDGNFRTEPPRIMYVDDEGDKVLLATDEDLVAAVNFARVSGWKALTLHLEDDATPKIYRHPPQKLSREVSQQEGWTLMHTALVASAVTVLSISLVLYLRRSNS